MKKLKQKAGQIQSQNQKMFLKPKMLKALEILSLSLDQLQDQINTELIENPMLELAEPEYTQNDIEEIVNSENDAVQKTLDEYEQLSEILDSYNEYSIQNSFGEKYDKSSVFEKVIEAKIDKKQEFCSQLYKLYLTDDELEFAVDFIDEADEYGFLAENFTMEQFIENYNIKLVRAEEIHQQILHFQPAGITAKNIEECLLSQVYPTDKTELLRNIIQNDFNELLHRRYKKIANKYKITEEKILQLIKIISQLDPKPGLRIRNEKNNYVSPDITLKKIGNAYEIVHNNQSLPKVRLSRYYRSIIKQVHQDEKMLTYFQDRLNAARHLMKMLHSRGKTLEKVMRSIINHQHDYFYNNSGVLKPLVYATIASELEVTPSTISRTVSNKYVDTPFGVKCLKDYFTTIATKNDDSQLSRRNLENKIQKIIDLEDKSKPLTDLEIFAIMQKKGVAISRRLIAKYRDEKGILNSFNRKIK